MTQDTDKLDDSSQEDEDLESALAKVEGFLLSLKQRIAQVEQDQGRRQELKQRQQELKQQQRDNKRKEPIKTELRHIQQELEAIELNLESRLVSWSSFKEPFWQIVRFGGLGVVIGWLLKSCAG